LSSTETLAYWVPDLAKVSGGWNYQGKQSGASQALGKTGTALALSPTQTAAALDTGVLRMQIRGSTAFGTINAHTAAITLLAYSANGRYLASSTGAELKVWLATQFVIGGKPELAKVDLTKASGGAKATSIGYDSSTELLVGYDDGTVRQIRGAGNKIGVVDKTYNPPN
jgi:hypothetical protein